MTGKSLWIRAASLTALMIMTALFMAKRSGREIIVAHAPLEQFPDLIGTQWSGRSVPIDPRVIEILGAGDFAERDYQRAANDPSVDLFVGYFPSQRTGVSIHSPKNCLPGGGWFPLQSKYLSLSLPNGRSYSVNEYVVQKGDQKQLVLYWYQAHGRLVASEYAAKMYLVADSIRLNRSDAALVRIITPILGNESDAGAERRVVDFAGAVFPTLEKYIPA